MKKIAYREFRKGLSEKEAARYPSMKDSFSDAPIARKPDIVEFLTHGGEALIVGMAWPRDVFTGAPIPGEVEIRSDGSYEWRAELAYYVDKYNLQLPQDFVDHILAVA